MEFRGRARTILFQGGWPFTKLVISNSRIEVRCLFKLVAIEKSEVITIETASGWRPSVRIWNNPEALPQIEFWSSSLPRIVRALELHGYKVKADEKAQKP